MTISVEWPSTIDPAGVITIPKADTVLVDPGPPEVRSYDLNKFRGELGDAWASGAGGVHSQPFNHTRENTTAGYTYARAVNVLPPYRVEFESSGAYVVLTEGANHNLLDVISFTTGVNVVTQNSGGLINVSQVDVLTFEGGVHVNIAEGVSGTTYPTGTPAQPVNNLADAITIVGLQQLPHRIFIHGNITIASATPSLAGYEIVGDRPLLTTVTLGTNAVLSACEFSRATLTGELDANVGISNCYLDDLAGLTGEVRDCTLLASASITTAGNLNLFNCHSVGGDTTPPVINVVSGNANIQGFVGHLELANMTGATQSVEITISGHLRIAASVTDGDIEVLGSGSLTDACTGSTVVDSANFISRKNIAEVVNSYQGSRGPGVYINTYAGNPGDVLWENGTALNPVDNITHALSLCAKLGRKVLYITGLITLPAGDYEDFNFIGNALERSYDNVHIEDANCYGSTFSHIRVTGDFSPDLLPVWGVRKGGHCAWVESSLHNMDNVQGYFWRCEIDSTNRMPTASDGPDTKQELFWINCFEGSRQALQYDPPHTTALGCGGSADCYREIVITGYPGDLTLQDVGHTKTRVRITQAGGQITIDSSCSAGSVMIDGHGARPVVDPSATCTVDYSRLLIADDLTKVADLMGTTGKVVEHKDAVLGGANGHMRVPADGSEQDIAVKQVSEDTVRLNEA